MGPTGEFRRRDGVERFESRRGLGRRRRWRLPVPSDSSMHESLAWQKNEGGESPRGFPVVRGVRIIAVSNEYLLRP